MFIFLTCFLEAVTSRLFSPHGSKKVKNVPNIIVNNNAELLFRSTKIIDAEWWDPSGAVDAFLCSLKASEIDVLQVSTCSNFRAWEGGVYYHASQRYQIGSYHAVERDGLTPVLNAALDLADEAMREEIATIEAEYLASVAAVSDEESDEESDNE